MSSFVICGGGICGLGTALLLAEDGHDVTLLERDAAPLPDSSDRAWAHWERKGVAQFQQPHNFMPGLREILEAELPAIQEMLPSAGAYRWDMLGPLLARLPDQSPRPGDDRFSFWTARRPAGEWVFGQAAQNHPRIDVRRGVQVTGLLTGTHVRADIPHVAGVTTAAGEQIRADFVIDAMGRRSRGPDWLVAIGARRPEEISADSGFTYYTRYFSGGVPEMLGPALARIGSIAILRLPGDHDTRSVTIFTASGDRPLKEIRKAEVWTKVVEACPLHAPWLGEPISDVLAMSGIMDRYRRFVLDGRPVATGFLAVADAWACTNPSAGRGLTVGFKHALRLRNVLRDATADPYQIALAFDEVTEREVAPWYWAQLAVDRDRIAEITAIQQGRPHTPSSDPIVQFLSDLNRFVLADADLARALLEYGGTLTPIQDIAKRPEIVDKLAALKAEATDDVAPPAIPGPDRAQLLELVS